MVKEAKIKAVLFDLGETLLTFGKVDALAYFREGARLTYDFIRGCGQNAGNFRLYCLRNLLALRVRHLLTQITGRDFDSLEFLKKLGGKRGIVLDQSQWDNLVWLWYLPLSKAASVEPDIVKTLSALKKGGRKIGIVSNTFVNARAIERHLKEAGISDLFDFKLYSYETVFRKPRREIFETAAERAGEKFENIMFVGDRVDNDIKPALRLGMTAVLKDAYTNRGRKVPAGAWKINRISELPTLLDKIETG